MHAVVCKNLSLCSLRHGVGVPVRVGRVNLERGVDVEGWLQEGAGDALTSSLTSISEPLQQLAPSVASSMDAEECASVCASAAGDAASVSEQGRPRPSRTGRRGSKRKGPWVSVYSGSERTCRVDGELAFTH